MATIDRNPPDYNNQSEEDAIKYRLIILKALEYFEKAVAVATNAHDDSALSAIQNECCSILKSASESRAEDLQYCRCE